MKLLITLSPKMILLPFTALLLLMSSCGRDSQGQREISQDTSSGALPDTANTVSNAGDTVMLKGDTGRQPASNAPDR